MTAKRVSSLIGALLGGVLSVAALWAQSQALPSDAIGFNYSDASLTASSVTSFQVSWDGSAFQAIGIPRRWVLADTPSGLGTYKVPIPFEAGTHTFQVRVCNAVGCSEATAPFDFTVQAAATGPNRQRTGQGGVRTKQPVGAGT